MIVLCIYIYMHVNGDVSNSVPAIFRSVIFVFVEEKPVLHGSGSWPIWLKHAFWAFSMIRRPVFLGHQEAGIRISSWKFFWIQINTWTSGKIVYRRPADLSLSFTLETQLMSQKHSDKLKLLWHQEEATVTWQSKIPRKATHVLWLSPPRVRWSHSLRHAGDLAQAEDLECHQQLSEPRRVGALRDQSLWDLRGLSEKLCNHPRNPGLPSCFSHEQRHIDCRLAPKSPMKISPESNQDQHRCAMCGWCLASQQCPGNLAENSRIHWTDLDKNSRLSDRQIGDF